jgi:metallo-beta-lactamase class B
MIRSGLIMGACLAWAAPLYAQQNDWNTPHAPFKVFGNTYYVGTQGITAVLVASPDGHVLIDGGTVDATPLVVASIATLGFDIKDVRVILNTHAHFDHAGALSALQRLSGAVVKASPDSAPVLTTGKTAANDPQAGMHADMQPVANVVTLTDGEVVTVGTTRLKPLFTPGHTAGGTSWAWQSCEGEGAAARCLNIVFADSLTAVSSMDFLFSKNTTYPTVVSDFAKSFAAITSVPCDILMSGHPGFSHLWARLEKRDAGDANALVDTTACQRYAENARVALGKRLATESEKQK